MGEPGFTVLPVLIHGDAAFAGQGVVAETLELSQLRGYRTGGTVHIVVNNQVGFTTAPEYSRSSVYSTDVARMIQAPIFHVNGDDPEAVVRVGQLAFEYRQAFSKDVVIDMICYRRRGHNEADNPSFTQPLMYDLIDAKRSVRKLYTESLIGRGDITLEEAEQALRDYQQELERAFTETRDAARRPRPGRGDPAGRHRPAARSTTAARRPRSPRRPSSGSSTPSSTCPRASPRTRGCSRSCSAAPPWSSRTRSTGPPASCSRSARVLIDGHTVRLVGQDTRRGTFGQRHAVLVDRHTGAEYTPLRAFNSASARFHAYDSLLSEFAAVGFEYGYSVARPDALVCWEAQFGDFVNGAQTIVDEFISSGEQKWGQRSGVVLLLPHGYEGQGPDHSSARIERFLSLCAQDNMTVAVPSTPANYFHLLRWQALSGRLKPLIVFTPKSMLRLKAATSAVADFTTGSFRPVIGDDAGLRPGGGAPGAAVLRQGLLRPGGAAGRGRADGHRDRPGRAALPAARRRDRGRAGTVPGRRGDRLGAGGAGQHGRLADHGDAAARALGRPVQLVSLPASSAPAAGRPRARGRAPALVEAALYPDEALSRDADVLHRPRHRGAAGAARRGRGQPGLAGRAAARVRRPVPGGRGAVDRLATWLARLEDEEALSSRRQARWA